MLFAKIICEQHFFKGESMKKIFLAFLTLFFSVSLAATTAAKTNWDSASALKRVNTVGGKILKANNINHNIQFKVSDTEDVNAYANVNKEIYVFRGLLEFVENDQELAAVIGHEMGHIINGHCAKQTVLSTISATAISMTNASDLTKSVGQELASSKLSRNDEFEADLTGIDLMSKTGYNPLGMVSLLQKISTSYIDIMQSHPSGEKRVLNAYDYINYNNPKAIKGGYPTESYKKALASIQPTLDKRAKNKKLMAKYEKEQKKLIKKKEKRASKMSKTSTVWDGYYSTLQLMAQ